MGIKSRLRRLEEQEHHGICPECGLPPDGHGRLVVIYEEHPEKSFQGEPDERCASCGRALYTVIRVVYEGDEGGGGKL